jgi:hypothetical protein
MRLLERRLADGEHRSARALRSCTIAFVLVAALVAAPAASAQPTPFQDIHSNGPLTDIWIGNDLSCQVAHTGDSSPEFFPASSGPGDCGTFLSEAAGNAPTIYGPDFSNHAGGSATGSFDTPFTPVSQSGVTGSGTAASPYQVTTAVTADNTGLDITEVDSYVVGNDYYTTNITLTNIGDTTFSGIVYHAGDCFLRSFDTGYGAVGQSNVPACTVTANDSPSSALEEFVPLTGGTSHYVETGFSTVWSDLAAQTDLPNTCDCTTNEDNGAGINWDSNLNPGAANAQQFSMQTKISDPSITATGGRFFTGNAPATISGAVATIIDSDTSTAPSDYRATVNWGDGSTPDQNATISGATGSFTVADSHTYTAAGSYTITVTVSYANNPGNTATASDSASIGARPVSVTGPPSVLSSTGAAFSGSLNPDGLPTTVFFEYGLDPKYSGGGPVVYDQSTPTQQVGSDFVSHAVSASVSGLVPNALYHARIVASNANGTTYGPDQTFTTGRAPAPSAPVLGQTANVIPVSGLVFIKPPAGKTLYAVRALAAGSVVKGQGFIPLTQARQVPIGSEIDARRGTLKLVVASTKKHHTMQARLTGSVFSLSQARSGLHKGLTTFALKERAFAGAPSYASCTARKASIARAGPDAQLAKLSPKVLQTLKASDHGGKFRTKGRYSAATVRGTDWWTAERCDGTLTIVKRGSVSVFDDRTRKTIIVKAGHSYLAKAP